MNQMVDSAFLPGATSASRERKVRILSLLRQRGPMTRAEIARASGIAKSSVSILIDKLLLDGHVHEVRASSDNRSKSVRGRPGDLIVIDPSAGAAIGIEISFGKLIGVIGDVSHEVLASTTIEFDPSSSSNQLMKMCQSVVSELLSTTRVTPSRILGIGLGIASSINKYGEDGFNFSQGLENKTSIENRLSELTGFEVHVENSANLAGYAETIWGAGKAFEYFLYFKLDQDIDGALIVNQSVVSGAKGGVADFGHIVLDSNGPMCTCGLRGCLTAYAGFESAIRQASVALGHEVSLKIFLDFVEQGDFLCKQILEDCAVRLGQGMSYLSRVLNPEAIVLGSSCVTMSPDFTRALTQSFSSYSPNKNSQIRILDGNLGDLAGALGAAATVLNHPLVAI
jgi:predicted NBD/HSP70 family sugar kinase